MDFTQFDGSKTVFGSPSRRTVYAVGTAALFTAVTTLVLLGLYRVSVELEFIGRSYLLSGATVVEGTWQPDWWDWVWFGVLVSFYVGAVFFGIRHTEQGGGLLGTIAYVVSVPLGTVIYQWATVEYPHSVSAFESPDVIFVHRFGYPLLQYATNSPHWLDYFVGIAAVIVIFGVGRHLTTQSDRVRTDLLVVTTLFVGAFLSG